MKAHVLKGSKQEIAERLIQIRGVIREAIVFEDEVSEDEGLENEPTLRPSDTAPYEAEDIFAEMSSFMVDLERLDDSREAIYTQSEGE